MKKLLAVLLALGLLVAFTGFASAADFKMSGYYFIEGRYVDANSLAKDAADEAGPSNAFYWQKFRINPVLQVADGLKLTIRIDAHTGLWNGNYVSPLPGYSNTNHQNLRWRRTYIDAALPYGLSVRAGYTQGGTFGTLWCDGAYDEARIYLFAKMGPGTLLGLTAKTTEGDYLTDKADNDNDKYAVGYLGKIENIEFGALWYYLRYNKTVTDAAGSYNRYWHAPMAYMKGTFGPLYLEAEVNYYFGKDKEYFDSPGSTDIDRGGWSAYVNGKFNMGPAAIGVQFGWLQGDDPDTTDKNEAGYGGETAYTTGTSTANCDYDPCLILFNSDYNDTIGNMGTYATTSGSISNAWLAQVYGEFAPVEKLKLFASFTWAKADQKPRIGGKDFVSEDYGYEVDVTATYKIYDNLDYMVGFGYFFTGDYYKGTSDSNEVENNYVVLNRLTLNF
jgi:hypothetical protein